LYKDGSGARYLRDLSTNSGGRLLIAGTVARVQEALSQITEELRHQYTIWYYPTHDGSLCRIRVTGEGFGMKWISKMVIIFVCAAAANAFFEQDKPWLRSLTDWSERDVQKILSDSPWAQMQDEVAPAAIARKGSGPKLQTIYRFLSAKVIRQALYRSIELNRESTASQIEAARRFMESQYEDTIVISVSYAGPLMVPLQRSPRFSMSTTALLRNDTYLTCSNGRKLFLKEYQPPGQDGLGAKFVFQRYVDGRLFIGPDDKVVRFDVEQLQIHNIQFKVADMKVAGVLQY
jgi:hypothetical protein